MKIFALTAAIAAFSAVEAADQASIHLRVHDKGSCTITNESQCNGQNWTGSTCCADPNYECRRDDYGQNVDRCQKKKGSSTNPGTGNPGTGSGVADWGACTGGLACKTPGSVCVKHSNYYSQCKPATLPTGELCGQNDGTNVWKYDKCPSNQKCAPLGTDFRCTNKKHHKKSATKDESCTITNESQCDGQNWTGSTCCADPNYECRQSDDGQDVKRCQKIGDGGYTDSEDSYVDDDDYSYTDDYSYVDDVEYTSYVDDWGDCTSDYVGCSNPTSYCVYHSKHYAQCKPEILPPGELCGQDDGTNVWWYPYCTSGESCQPLGSDYRCTKNKKRHHHHRRQRRA
ncbi:hypothetical protein F442_20325 [Phytophthora nicotianae P10297]|uniref:CBM1 domain-containing protein n=3 Tax=Phytophthora nicotianae TaxID=4792 RepID=W2QWL9_PHYN3|nr:hypothetical protein PPTG_05834 [Phytophthora nicotianae INRA-310]ETL79744.1 hypothetical protein L917_19689 [Phytophthora nicotianae]ETN16680.1 hypothetical protein PPTG_05834 [Phytophthora nicotianae INRA-310]ETP30735.1 hypothetical protein F442_20325 [Phytophthora nicotianae P10297]